MRPPFSTCRAVQPLAAGLFALTVPILLFVCSAGQACAAHHLAQGVMAGDVTATSVLLQSRLTATSGKVDDDVPGAAGVARFELAGAPDFSNSRFTGWKNATAEGDYIVCWKVDALQPATRYWYRLHYGTDQNQTQAGPVATFQTLPGATGSQDVSFVVVTGMDRGMVAVLPMPAPTATRDSPRWNPF